jgi:hypothetical protein
MSLFSDWLFFIWNTICAGMLIPSERRNHYMTLQQKTSASAPIPTRSEKFRLKALFSEQRARESTDQRSKRDWEELAIEWHMMANLAAGANGDSSRIEMA